MADGNDFDALTKAAKGNYIRLDNKAALNCASMCHDLIVALNKAIGDADGLATTQGFGNIPDATALEKRYNDRANNGDSSLQHALTKHRDIVTSMMDTFIAAGRAYMTNENASVTDLRSYDQAMSLYKKTS